MIGYLSIYTLLFILLICTVYVEKYKKYHLLAKSLNSIVFVLIAYMGYSTHDSLLFYHLLFIAFIGCFIGDFFLAVVKKNSYSKFFIIGAAFFLLGHIFFIAALYNISPISWKDFIVPIISVIIMSILMTHPDIETGRLSPYILLYAIFLSWNFSKTLRLLIDEGGSQRNLLLCSGALLFMISDIIIFFIHFSNKKYRLSHFFNLLTYYYGVLLLALSLWY